MSEWFSEEHEMDETTAKNFEELADSLFVLRGEKENLKEALKQIEGQAFLIEQKVIRFLEEFGKTGHISKYGKLTRIPRTSVKVPRDPADKEAFFGYLKSMGIFEEMATINSRTLNAFYKNQFEVEMDKGNIDFVMPGIGEATVTETLRLTKAKIQEI